MVRVPLQELGVGTTSLISPFQIWFPIDVVGELRKVSLGQGLAG